MSPVPGRPEVPPAGMRDPRHLLELESPHDGMQSEQPVKRKQWPWRGQTEEHSIGLGSVHIS